MKTVAFTLPAALFSAVDIGSATTTYFTSTPEDTSTTRSKWSTESGILFTEISTGPYPPLPSVCIAPQSPPFTCERCPEEDIQHFAVACDPHGYCGRVQWSCLHEGPEKTSLTDCHRSIEDCCENAWVRVGGYGSDYCINKSSVTTTSTPYITADIPDNTEIPHSTEQDMRPTLCIAPHINDDGAKTCEPCLQEDILLGGLCDWYIEQHTQYGGCFESVEECCEVFQFDGAEEVQNCIKSSGPGDCISLQFPPFTCEQCPEEDRYYNYLCSNPDDPYDCSYGWRCAPDGMESEADDWGMPRYEQCRRSVEDCCGVAAVDDDGYGYDYCVNRSNTSEDTTTTTPASTKGDTNTAETAHVHEKVCITADFHGRGTCGQCPETPAEMGWCEWYDGNLKRYGVCFDSVEKCCEAFQFSGNEMATRCVNESK